MTKPAIDTETDETVVEGGAQWIPPLPADIVLGVVGVVGLSVALTVLFGWAVALLIVSGACVGLALVV